ncbi:MAG: cation-transporting P-type ATPase [Minisyncoccia bacterium]
MKEKRFLDKIENHCWHALDIGQTFQVLNTQKEGLKEKEVEERQKIYGLNKIEEVRKTSLLKLYLKQFKSPLIYILLIGGIIALFLKDFTDSIVIFSTIIINSFIGFFQEKKTNQIFQQLQSFLKKTAKVRRNGVIKEIEAENLVPGDIIILEAGQQVPADARLIEVDNLKINESILTGEWLAKIATVEKLDKDIPLADRDNLVFMGTLVEEGKGEAVVINIGKDTELGKVGFVVQDIKKEKTAFQKKVENLSKLLGAIILFFCHRHFYYWISHGQKFY